MRDFSVTRGTFTWSCLQFAVQAYAANPNRTDVLLLIGAIYYQKKNYEQCIAFNDRCILLDPSMAEAHANLANALQQLGNYDMAIIYYQVRRNRREVHRQQPAGGGGFATGVEVRGTDPRAALSSVMLGAKVVDCLVLLSAGWFRDVDNPCIWSLRNTSTSVHITVTCIFGVSFCFWALPVIYTLTAVAGV